MKDTLKGYQSYERLFFYNRANSHLKHLSPVSIVGLYLLRESYRQHNRKPNHFRL